MSTALVPLDKKLGADATVEDYIHDFVNSDNPRFDGKSKRERIRMALGAFYARKNLEVAALLKANDCHNPPGEGGGQFCSGGEPGRPHRNKIIEFDQKVRDLESEVEQRVKDVEAAHRGHSSPEDIREMKEDIHSASQELQEARAQLAAFRQKQKVDEWHAKHPGQPYVPGGEKPKMSMEELAEQARRFTERRRASMSEEERLQAAGQSRYFPGQTQSGNPTTPPAPPTPFQNFRDKVADVASRIASIARSIEGALQLATVFSDNPTLARSREAVTLARAATEATRSAAAARDMHQTLESARHAREAVQNLRTKIDAIKTSDPRIQEKLKNLNMQLDAAQQRFNDVAARATTPSGTVSTVPERKVPVINPQTIRGLEAARRRQKKTLSTFRYPTAKRISASKAVQPVR